MQITQSGYDVRIEMKLSEMRVLLDELLDAPGGSRCPKMRQLCHALEVHFRLHGDGFNAAAREAEAVQRRRKKKTAT